jgi:hypothetical protein
MAISLHRLRFVDTIVGHWSRATACRFHRL